MHTSVIMKRGDQFSTADGYSGSSVPLFSSPAAKAKNWTRMPDGW